jgi:hypothetical protein
MHRDFKELLSAFIEGHVKYLVVGGYAVSAVARTHARMGAVPADAILVHLVT